MQKKWERMYRFRRFCRYRLRMRKGARRIPEKMFPAGEEPGSAEKALSEYSFAELRNMAKELGLKADGKRDKLEERIAAYRAGEQEKSEDEDCRCC